MTDQNGGLGCDVVHAEVGLIARRSSLQWMEFDGRETL
jgi:hypothetical protein